MAVVGNQPARLGLKFISGDDWAIRWALRDYASKEPINLDLCAIDFTLLDIRKNTVLELSFTNGRLARGNGGVITGIVSKEETAEVVPKKGLWFFSITSPNGFRKTLANGPFSNNAPGRINDTDKRISTLRLGSMEWVFLPGETTPPANTPLEFFGKLIGAADSSDAYPADLEPATLFESMVGDKGDSLSESAVTYESYYSDFFN